MPEEYQKWDDTPAVRAIWRVFPEMRDMNKVARLLRHAGISPDMAESIGELTDLIETPLGVSIVTSDDESPSTVVTVLPPDARRGGYVITTDTMVIKTRRSWAAALTAARAMRDYAVEHFSSCLDEAGKWE